MTYLLGTGKTGYVHDLPVGHGEEFLILHHNSQSLDDGSLWDTQQNYIKEKLEMLQTTPFNCVHFLLSADKMA